jgi:hypothetical protein
VEHLERYVYASEDQHLFTAHISDVPFSLPHRGGGTEEREKNNLDRQIFVDFLCETRLICLLQ